jgi:hypothetical protein
MKARSCGCVGDQIGLPMPLMLGLSIGNHSPIDPSSSWKRKGMGRFKWYAIDAALQALDDIFTSFCSDGEVATITGEIEVEMVRPVDDQFLLTIVFPGGAEFVVRCCAQSLQTTSEMTKS